MDAVHLKSLHCRSICDQKPFWTLPEFKTKNRLFFTQTKCKICVQNDVTRNKIIIRRGCCFYLVDKNHCSLVDQITKLMNELRKISPSSPMFAALFPFAFDCIAPFHGGNSLNLINPSFQNAEQSYQGLSKFMLWKVQWGWQVPQKHYN